MREKKDLVLVLKHKWFDMIESGVKKEEYREIKESMVSKLFDWRYSGYSLKEFTDVIRTFGNDALVWQYLKPELNNVRFHRAYTSTTATYDFVEINVGNAKPEWSDNWEGKCFVISLGEKII